MHFSRSGLEHGCKIGAICWLKLLYEGIMCIFSESAYFIGPADVPEGSGPPKISEVR